LIVVIIALSLIFILIIRTTIPILNTSSPILS
jgi:hypothetical protein